MNPSIKDVALTAIGNPLAGDDGVGPVILDLMEARWGTDPRVCFLRLETDLFALSDLLDAAHHFLFVDARLGAEPGALLTPAQRPRSMAPSLHQLDVMAVMDTLNALGMITPFPTWEVWSVAIPPPQEFHMGLSPSIAAAAQHAAGQLDARMQLLLGSPATFMSPSRGAPEEPWGSHWGPSHP